MTVYIFLGFEKSWCLTVICPSYIHTLLCCLHVAVPICKGFLRVYS